MSVWVESQHPRNPDGTFTYKVTNLPGGGTLVTSSSRVNKVVRSGGGVQLVANEKGQKSSTSYGGAQNTGKSSSKISRNFVAGQKSVSTSATRMNSAPLKQRRRS